jgi:hypothetical protein
LQHLGELGDDRLGVPLSAYMPNQTLMAGASTLIVWSPMKSKWPPACCILAESKNAIPLSWRSPANDRAALLRCTHDCNAQIHGAIPHGEPSPGGT